MNLNPLNNFVLVGTIQTIKIVKTGNAKSIIVLNHNKELFSIYSSYEKRLIELFMKSEETRKAIITGNMFIGNYRDNLMHKKNITLLWCESIEFIQPKKYPYVLSDDEELKSVIYSEEEENE